MTTTNLGLTTPAPGSTGWSDSINSNFESIDLVVPVGEVRLYLGEVAPTGWLLCQGQSVANDTYPQLLAVLLQAIEKWGRAGSQASTANASSDEVEATNHGLADGQIVYLSTTGAMPTGLEEDTIYYVVSASSNAFQLATEAGGSAISISTNGTGSLSYHTAFTLPDLRGRTVIGAGQGLEDDAADPIAGAAGPPAGASMTQRDLGTYGGEEAHQLTPTELASHDHTPNSGLSFLTRSGSGSTAFNRSEGGSYTIADSDFTSTSGSDTPHNTMPPWVAIQFIVRSA